VKDLDCNTFAVPQPTPDLAVATLANDVLQLDLPCNGSLDQQWQAYQTHNRMDTMNTSGKDYREMSN